MQLGYLDRLTLQLTAGAALLPAEQVDSFANYLYQRQRSDGGWAGREGDSDLYYTSFALRSLAILGLLEGEVADRAAKYLRSRLDTPQAIVDILAMVYGARLIQAACGQDPFASITIDWASRLAGLLSSLRRSDGGFAKSYQGQAGSTYQTFLVILCLELIGHPLPSDDRAVDFLLAQRQADGGFLEVRVAKRSGTNPTAAAIGGLKALDRLSSDVATPVIDFLLDLQTDQGGIAANTRMPIPDLLSTFTGSLTLWDLQALDQAEIESMRRYVLSMQRDHGGFAGFELDPADDVEYTFYGVGSLALLASLH